MRRLLERHPPLRARLDEPTQSFDSPPIVAFAGDPAMVDVLLAFGADSNRRSDWWAGAFHALHSATPETAERLIAAGATVDACAAAHLDRPELLARLLAEDPARVHERGGDGQTPLHFARSIAVADLLLDAGADIDARDVDHRSTPAQWMLDRARDRGRYHVAQHLVDRGATMDLFLAAALGRADAARALLAEDPSRLEARTGHDEYGERPPSSFHIYFWTIGAGRSPLDVAAQFEQRETLDAMLELATPEQRFVTAARRGDATTARGMIEADPGLVASLPRDTHRLLADAAWNGDAPAVALMVALGFDPRATAHDGGTALHCAAWQGSSACTEAVLRHPDARALLEVRDGRYGATPLGWCAHGSRFGDPRGDHAGVARRLLEAGAAPDVTDASPAVLAAIEQWRARGAALGDA